MDLKVSAVDGDHSPLLRIMSLFDSGHATYQKFSNNICAFHVGNGYILSVAHNLRTQEPLPFSIPATVYTSEILTRLSPQDQTTLGTFYRLDVVTQKYHLSNMSPQTAPQAIAILNSAAFDRRFIRMYENAICSPHLIIQFRENRFYSLKDYSNMLAAGCHFHEADLGRHTFKLQLEIVKTFYEDDWVVYRIKDLAPEAVALIPKYGIDYSLYRSLDKGYYCLQAAPVNNLGRLLNRATIDGIIDHFNIFHDPHAGNYFMQGLRYLISGYFRFGSSGAPYLKLDRITRRLRINAIQSEACPLQLTIANDRNGNFQYVNAIASPIFNVKKELMEILK